MGKYIWIGHKESELYKVENIFDYSITSWGSGKEKNISYSNLYSSREIDNNRKKEFICNTLKNLLTKEKYHVMFYSSTLAYSLLKTNPEFESNFICLNDKILLNLLNNKINTRLWFSNYMPIINFTLFSGEDCDYQKLCNNFPDYKSFIIQEASSSGGLGTYILEQRNYVELKKQFRKNNLYLASIYAVPSFSLNVHILVTKEKTIVFPASIQLVQEYDNKLLYTGADFKGFTYINQEYKNKISTYSKIIGEKLSKVGYRGICGIDFIVYENEVYFVEINPRFQASTFLINMALAEASFPSMQELQLKAFNNEIFSDIDSLENISVPFSFYKYKKEKQDKDYQYMDKLKLLENSSETYNIQYNGYKDDDYKDEVYLFEVVWKRHISSYLEDNKLHIHPNIPMQYFMKDALPLVYSKDILIKLKISLLNQGIRVSSNACIEMEKMGGYNESVFNSIDILLFKNLRMNAPVNIFLNSLSPYELNVQKHSFYLYYYRTKICEVELESNKSFINLKTQNGIPYKQIAFISGDRLRIKPEAACYFKKNGSGCIFCHENKRDKLLSKDYGLEDIEEVIDYCIKNEQFRHILIGGGSANPCTDNNKILPVIKYIRSRTSKQIYLMCLPPNDINYINKYIDAGVDEIAFNIELFDRELAKKYMPGKGQIALEDYITKLQYATFFLGSNGNVRTMLMVGLEKIENTLSAIRLLAARGIQPMLSIFRPVPNCKLFYAIQPSNEDMYMLFYEAEKICKQYNLFLGPSCPSCQNNTLAITLKQD